MEHFIDQDDFLDFIDNKSANTEWLEMKLPEFVEKLESTVNGLVFKNGLDGVYFRETCLRSLRQRIFGENALLTALSLDALTKYDEAELLKEYLEWFCESAPKYNKNLGIKVAICDNQVNAVLSPEYVETVNESSVYNAAFEMLLLSTNSSDFECEGWYDYDQSMLQLTTDSLKEIGDDEYKKVLCVRTSDAGYSSIAVSVMLQNSKGRKLPMADPMYLAHRSRKKSSAAIAQEFNEKFSELISKTDAVLTEALKNVERLKKIKLLHPTEAYKTIAKEIGISKKDICEVPIINGDTAWDVYEALCEIVDVSWSVEKRIKNYGNLSKIMGIRSWDKY